MSVCRGNFDVFITVDQNMRYQQNFDAVPLSVIVLVTRSNRIEAILPLVPQLKSALDTIKPKSVVYVGPG
jgi:hypothetical protein